MYEKAPFVACFMLLNQALALDLQEMGACGENYSHFVTKTPTKLAIFEQLSVQYLLKLAVKDKVMVISLRACRHG